MAGLRRVRHKSVPLSGKDVGPIMDALFSKTDLRAIDPESSYANEPDEEEPESGASLEEQIAVGADANLRAQIEELNRIREEKAKLSKDAEKGNLPKDKLDTLKFRHSLLLDREKSTLAAIKVLNKRELDGRGLAEEIVIEIRDYTDLASSATGKL